MPLNGEYQPSRNDRTREQVELYEATNVRRQTGHRADLQGCQVRQDSEDASDENRAQRYLRRGRFIRRRSYPSPYGTATSSPIRSSNCRMALSSTRCGPGKPSAKKRIRRQWSRDDGGSRCAGQSAHGSPAPSRGKMPHRQLQRRGKRAQRSD
jgi:hypothetical protein